MAFRSELEAARARIAQLEEDNRQLRAEVRRLSGAEPVSEPPPPAVTSGKPIWSPGSSWLFGVATTTEGTACAYTGERSGRRYLRVTGVGNTAVADYRLADQGNENAARIGDGVVVQLHDGTLGWISWPGHEITRRFRLPAPLIAQPIERDGAVLAVTADRELLRIDPDGWRVTARHTVSVAALEELGIPDPQGRQMHNGHKAPSSVMALEKDGWSVEAVRTLGGRVLCAFNREFAGNEQVAVAVLDGRSGRPLWFREAGPGSFIYLYQVDEIAIVHNVGLDVEVCAWGFRMDTGALVFRIAGRGADAVFETYDSDEQPLARSRP